MAATRGLAVSSTFALVPREYGSPRRSRIDVALLGTTRGAKVSRGTSLGRSACSTSARDSCRCYWRSLRYSNPCYNLGKAIGAQIPLERESAQELAMCAAQPQWSVAAIEYPENRQRRPMQLTMLEDVWLQPDPREVQRPSDVDRSRECRAEFANSLLVSRYRPCRTQTRQSILRR